MVTPKYKTVRDLPVEGQTVLVRVDYNVPLAAGQVADDTRIRASIPTLRYLRERDCRLVLMSHLGRPGGQVQPDLRLDPVAVRLEQLSGWPVKKVDEVAGPGVQQVVAALPPGGLVLLENVRFDPREEADDPTLAQELAGLADFFVNDAFGTAHRSHASTAGVARHLPSAAGLLLERELDVLGRLLDRPKRPFWAVVGGAKIGDKLGVLNALVRRCDGLALGGGMANTFLAAQGYDLAASLLEPELLDEARSILTAAKNYSCQLLLPTDLVAADNFAADARHQKCAADDLPAGWQALDVGPATVELFSQHMAGAGTVFWNGPLGVFEWDAFAQGTLALARQLAASDADVIVGGGDSVAAVVRAGVAPAMAHISTGGGATLEFVEGRLLPGVAALALKEVDEQ